MHDAAEARAKVVVRDVEHPPSGGPLPADVARAAVADVFERFGGGSSLLKSSGDVYVKPNGIDFKPFTHARPEVLEAVVEYFFEQGARRVHVVENSTQGNYTRLVFEVCGYADVCKRTGARPVYLDEESTEKFEFAGSGRRDYDLKAFRLPKTVARQLVRRRDENLYVSLPKLKTHSMTGVTLGIKNQWGFPAHADRGFDHNWELHHKLVDVLEVVRPDFTLIEGVEGTVHGHYPPEALHHLLVKPFGVLVGGTNVVAVDLVGARIFGLGPEDVPHLRAALERGLGEGVRSLADVEVDGDVSRFTEKHPTDLYPKFPPTVNAVEGSELACREGCKNNPLTLAQVLYLDFGANGRVDLVYGKGHDPAVIDALEGPVLVAGHCAVEEVGERLRRRLGKKRVVFSGARGECNDLASTAFACFKFMGVNPLDVIPLSAGRALRTIVAAKLHRSKARVPSVLSTLRIPRRK
ncbi:MAG: hypothetical protein Kow0069_33510 [Promethearchaeota archaeon]